MLKNYIFVLAGAFYLLNIEMNYDIAIACSSSLISSCLPHIRIPTSKGLPLSLDEMDLIIGLSGTVKSIPLRKTQEIARLIGLQLPSFTTTEGAEKYFSEKNEGNKYENRSYGLIINDEISKKFIENKRKDYAVGTIELYSNFYDHNIEDTYLAGDGYRDPQQPYVSVIAATITNFLPQIPDRFFTQGLAGRFNWIYCDDLCKDYNYDFDITDISTYTSTEKQFQQHVEKLKELHKKNPRKQTFIKMESDTNEIYKQFDKETTQQWQQAALHNLWANDYQYLKRLPEMAIKHAGRHAVGRCIDDILETGFENITINKEDMEYGVQRSKVSRKYIDQILMKRREGIRQKLRKPLIRTYSSERITAVLRGLGRANTKQWQQETGITDTATFNKYKLEALKKNMVRVVDKNKITEKRERLRLGADSPATKIWEVTSHP
jgi:hypothetical protein